MITPKERNRIETVLDNRESRILQLEESENNSVVRILVNKHDDDTQDQKEQQGDREGAGYRIEIIARLEDRQNRIHKGQVSQKSP